ncbi:MAG: M48 family metalloprotease [Desulfobacteraceae bacterium]|nr:M48 family metalloprotease [Desulfobacteraceae bacterium]
MNRTTYFPFLIFTGIILLVLSFSIKSYAISIPQEIELSKEFMKMIEKQQVIIKDPIVDNMITKVGNHIVSHLPQQPFSYSFFLIDDDAFNAFASPAANIFVHRGLITSLDNIDEFAGIIGHEIAHAVSRHVSESIDRAKYVQIGTMAGVLAGILIGSKTGGDTGAAVSTGAMAAGQSSMLAFTRENETEADEKGFMFLEKSCFSPRGLLSGLSKLRESDWQGVEGIPDYFKTHPGTSSRVAHLENILANYQPHPNKEKCKTNFRFEMVKYRITGLYGDIDSAIKTIGIDLKNNPENAAYHYGLGLALARKSKKAEAIDHFKKALSINIFDPMILLGLGRTYLESGDPQKAVNVLKGVEDDPVMGIMADYYLSLAALDTGDLIDAKKRTQRIIDQHPSLYPKAYYNMADIMAQEKQKGLSHYYLGIYYYEIKNSKNARIHLNQALKTVKDPKKFKRAEELLQILSEEKRNSSQN